MTDLKRPVTRCTGCQPRTARGEIVVTLEPGGIVRLREKGRRLGYTTSIAAIYEMAVKASVAAPVKRRVSRGILRRENLG